MAVMNKMTKQNARYMPQAVGVGTVKHGATMSGGGWRNIVRRAMNRLPGKQGTAREV
jgi:hypothetical protein